MIVSGIRIANVENAAEKKTTSTFEKWAGPNTGSLNRPGTRRITVREDVKQVTVEETKEPRGHVLLRKVHLYRLCTWSNGET